MWFFSKLFNQHSSTPDPKIQFGRYTDTYKADEKYSFWDKSIESFENEKYIKSYTHFLDFISNEGQDNVHYSISPGLLSFSIFQGSKIITGEANFQKFRAEAKIVKIVEPNLGLMRLLLEENFNLKYSKYSIDNEQCISLVFNTYAEDGSPHKIYEALKELATEADRKDDVLLSSFDCLVPINFNHTRRISEHEKKVKYDFFKKRIHEVLNEIDSGKLNTYLYPGGVSFLVLDLLYRIDFLIKPEGSVMECVRDCHNLFFNDTVTNVYDKNKEIIRKVRALDKMTFEIFEKELYEVNSTFGTSVPEGYQRLVEIIDVQLTDLDWYTQNNYIAYAHAICGYVVGYSLYAYSLPEPIRELLKLYYRINESNYFKALGFSNHFAGKGKALKSNIENEIKKILVKHSERYPGIKVNFNFLDVSDPVSFSKSYLIMLRNLSYPEE